VRHLNYNHLLYFHTVTSEGSVAAAARVLNITPQTISGQIKLLEESLGQALFIKVGRGLVMSDTGQLVKEYSDEIFSLGTALRQRLRHEPDHPSQTLRVGILDSIPKLIAGKLLSDSVVGAQEYPVKLDCREGNLDSLLAELAVHRIDLILSDRPVPSGLHVKAFNHALGTSDIGFYSPPKWARKLKAGFPESLTGVPMLLPNASSALRRSLDHWFDDVEVEPEVVAEFDDSALMKTFGDMAIGVYPAPEVIASDVAIKHHGVYIGTAQGVRESYVIISGQRRVRHPLVKKITLVGQALLNA